MITQIVDDIDWAYFYSQIPCNFLPDDIKEKLMDGIQHCHFLKTL